MHLTIGLYRYQTNLTIQDLNNIELDNQKWIEVQILQDHNTYSYT